jgi:hypothetical protein
MHLVYRYKMSREIGKMMAQRRRNDEKWRNGNEIIRLESYGIMGLFQPIWKWIRKIVIVVGGAHWSSGMYVGKYRLH